MIAKLAAAALLICGLAGTTGPAAAQAAVVTTRASSAVSAALPCSPPKGDKVIYYGGRVGYSGSLVIDFWGAWWSSHGAAVKTELSNLYNGLGASSWAATLKQYCGKNGAPAWDSQVDFSEVDPSAVPAAPTNSQMNQEAQHIWSRLKGQGVLVIVTPPGKIPAEDAKGACGYHRWTTVPGIPGLPWIDIPYGKMVKNKGCLGQSVPATLSFVAGHEWAEVVTDPFSTAKSATGWASAATATSKEQEVGDLCQPKPGGGNTFTLKLSTGSFTMQKLWSNIAGTKGECVAGS